MSKNALLIALNIFCIPLFSQTTTEIDKLKTIVYTIAADSMQGREAGTAGEAKARNYILACYEKIGLKPFHNSYTQKFSFPKDSSHTDTATNIIGMIDNKADSTIIIGAHYDHIGMGGPKSRSLTSNKIHPGADDNASGVAMMLELAEHFKMSKNKKFNYLFIAFSAEEEGLYGSQAFVNDKNYKSLKVKLMLNLVMVGRLDKQRPLLKAMRDNRDNHFDSLLNKHTDKFSITITDENLNFTDAGAFSKNKVPAVSFTTGLHDDYHKTSDTADKINYDGMLVITTYIENFIDGACK